MLKWRGCLQHPGRQGCLLGLWHEYFRPMGSLFWSGGGYARSKRRPFCPLQAQG